MRIAGNQKYRRKWTRYPASVRLSVIKMVYVDDRQPKPLETKRHINLGIAGKVRVKGVYRK